MKLFGEDVDKILKWKAERDAAIDALRNAAAQAKAVVSAAFRAEEKRLEEKSALHGHPVEHTREVTMPFIRASADLASARLLAEAALDRWAAEWKR